MLLAGLALWFTHFLGLFMATYGQRNQLTSTFISSCGTNGLDVTNFGIMCVHYYNLAIRRISDSSKLEDIIVLTVYWSTNSLGLLRALVSAQSESGKKI